MPVTLVLTATSPDKPGLIDLLSTTLAAHGANWQQSRMATLGGQFAGLLQASVPEKKLAALESGLEGLRREGLTVTIAAEPVHAPALGLRRVKLETTGQDRPGIIKEIAHALATRGISIDELESTCASASWSGEVMFKVTAELSVPADVATEQLCALLENLGNELMVDIAIEEERLPSSP